MRDRHLNLFYSYNRDNQLIENNLTRALVVTLRHLRPSLRKIVLAEIMLDAALDLDFEGVKFALQGNVDRASVAKAQRKYVLTLSSNIPQLLTGSREIKGRSIPDAWILGRENTYCILVESKVGNNPLNADQISDHAEGWLGLQGENESQRAIISSSWVRVCDALADIMEDRAPVNATPLEKELISELLQFLQFFGYRSFRGLARNTMAPPPAFILGAGKKSEDSSPRKQFGLSKQKEQQ